MKGPGIFLAQFISEVFPYNSFKSLCEWASKLGYKGIQIPTWESSIFDLKKAHKSKTYCDEIVGIAHESDIEISELSTHLQGQLIAVHPAYDLMFDSFAPPEAKNNPKIRQKWAVDQLKMAGKASQNLGLSVHATFSGSLMWHTLYPWPQRPVGLVEEGFQELAKRWLPILDFFDECGVDVCYEIHPGEDLHDGITFEKFLQKTNYHPRVKMLYDPSHFVLQQMDYLGYIDEYHSFIKMFHVKDAEYNFSPKSGVYGGYQPWIKRPGRFRSVGDGQVDFKTIFSKLAQYGYTGWAVLEWECCIKDSEQGAKEGAVFIENNMIKLAEKKFDDFASGNSDLKMNKKILGL